MNFAKDEVINLNRVALIDIRTDIEATYLKSELATFIHDPYP